MGGSDGNAIICQSMNCVMGQMDNSANIFTDKNIHTQQIEQSYI